MFFNYNAEQYEMQYGLLICDCFLTDGIYNRGMCGRYGFSVKNAKDVYERFDTYNELEDFKPRYNIAPGQLTRSSPNTPQTRSPGWCGD
jgi:hypothetical protein